MATATLFQCFETTLDATVDCRYVQYRVDVDNAGIVVQTRC
jgi:hypothetical protein